MSTPVSATSRHRPALAAWKPSARALLWVALAFVAGLLLFAWAVSGGRQDNLFRQGKPTSAPGREYAPLPSPLPAGESTGGASGMGKSRPNMPGDAERPFVVERPRPPAPTASPGPSTATTPAPARSAPTTLPMPVHGQTPAPRYPTRALRRGESGTVRIRVEVGPDGRPSQVSVAQTSGSRDLDRAGLDAVRRWRFQPARRNGEAVTGTVIVPISFTRD